MTVVVSSGPASAALTDVSGLTEAQAKARLKAAGFKTKVTKEPSTSVAVGRVISTEPSQGTEVQLGSTVTLLVSSGPAPVRVPDVVGQSLSSAEATLTNAELELGTVTKRDSATQQPGTVISQAPASGSSAHAGDKVSLVVAQAPNETAVPNVVGQNEAAAAAALGKAGFAPRAAPETVTEPSQVGIVLKQSPAAGTKARKGATVTLTVGELGTPTTPTTPSTTTPAPAPPVGAGG